MKKLLLTATVLLGAFSLYAQEIEDKEPLAVEGSEQISSLRLAADLVKYGYAQKSALPLIDALQIIAENQAQPGDSQKEEESVEVDLGGKQGNVTLNIPEIAKAAAEFSDGDVTLLALLTQVQNEAAAPSRGAVGGAKYNVDVVKANGTDTYNISFVAGRLAEVAVSGDGDTDLDLYVYDSNGNLIEKDADYTDDCYVSWVPKWTGRFKIKIVNRGRVANRYVLITN